MDSLDIPEDRESRIGEIVVVGGTLAGWAAAARLAATFGRAVGVTVLETPQDAPAADGSGRVVALAPQVQGDLFDRLGLQEETWMRACSASFTLAVRYVNWRTGKAAHLSPHPLPGHAPDFFDRPFAALPECEEFPLSEFWRLRRSTGETVEPMDRACFREPPLLDALRSPRWLDGRAAVPYGWHADAELLTRLLRRTALQRFGVRTAQGMPLGADRDGDGMLTALCTTGGTRLAGDLFLDCTGPASLLLGGVLHEPFTAVAGHPLTDRTVTVSVPHDSAVAGIEPYGTATALPYGWAWHRPLPDRIGAGLVCASAWTDEEHAVRTLCALWGLRPGIADVRVHSSPAGAARRAWVHNCVALGPAARSADPLADDGLAGVLRQLGRLVRDFPDRRYLRAPADRFNRAAAADAAAAGDLAQLLYRAAPRADTPFWRAHRELPLSDALSACLEGHRAGLPPEPGETPLRTLLAALDPQGGPPPAALWHRTAARQAADAHFTRIRRQQRILLETLPSAQAYLHRLHTRRAPDARNEPARRTPAPPRPVTVA
ncbi:tryptophan 7-halogenase [Streptomyces sp. NPDC048045]|uniref:tryptophan 7-halogenase n=1 Tax=Streptomyces sp. NPDC048045 TaxID=3154710 RepID=UPI00341915B8